MFEKVTSLWSGSGSTTPAPAADLEVKNLNPKGLKACCACPETKSARDACFMNTDSSEADDKCKELVQAHIACMRGYGFKV